MGVHVPVAPVAVQIPVMQAYVKHKLDPAHGVPSGAAGFEHMPVDGLHTPTVWQPSLAAHTTALVPVHVPLTQE